MTTSLAPAVAAGDTRWQDDALCGKLAGTAVFYPSKGAPSREAKEVCAGCPVRYDCLSYAIEHGEKYGIWAGMSERERRPLNRAYRQHYPAPRPPVTGGPR